MGDRGARTPSAPGPRLPALVPDELNDEQRGVYRSIVDGPRSEHMRQSGLIGPSGELGGPFNAMLVSPRIGRTLADLGAALRFSGLLSDRQRELAILVVASHCRNEVEWDLHAQIAGTLGFDAGQLQALQRGDALSLDDPVERVVLTAVRRLLDAGDLSDEEYEWAVDHLTPAGVVELTTLVGYYQLLAVQLRVFRVEAPVPPSGRGSDGP